MKNCTHCKYVVWKRTPAGKLHPSGEGKCTFPWKLPPLPASMYWVTRDGPTPNGGYVNRREELKDHCTYYKDARNER